MTTQPVSGHSWEMLYNFLPCLALPGMAMGRKTEPSGNMILILINFGRTHKEGS